MSQSLSSRRRTRNVWDVRADDEVDDSIRIPELIGFVLVAVPGIAAPGLGVPLNELGAALAVVAAVLRPVRREKVPWWLVVALVGIVGWLTAVSYAHDLTPYRRLLHLLLYAALVYLIASGRLHLPSAALGMGVGLVLSTAGSMAGLGPQQYAGRLSGLLGDPNLSGFTLTVLGTATIAALPRGRLRLVLMVLLPVAVVLTLSRTSLLAMTFAVVWVAVGRRIGVPLGAALVGAFVWVVVNIPPNLRLLGPFSDREGSDQLRQRLVDRERLDVALHPITGGGAGTARIELGSNSFFYHSSYLAAQREGGLVLVGLLILLAALVLLRLATMPRPQRNGWVEASVICLMVCALNLGEVLLELPAAVALGAGAWWALHPAGQETSSSTDPQRSAT